MDLAAFGSACPTVTELDPAEVAGCCKILVVSGSLLLRLPFKMPQTLFNVSQHLLTVSNKRDLPRLLSFPFRHFSSSLCMCQCFLCDRRFEKR